MKRCGFKLVLGMSGLLILSVSVLWFHVLGCAVSTSQSTCLPATPKNGDEDNNKLKKRAATITVKVLSQDFIGSGFILRKNKFIYTAVTNAHVLRAGKSNYRIQTSDGQIYTATPSPKHKFGSDDLAVLEFRSEKKYPTATLGVHPKLGDRVFAAGFPADIEANKAKEFVFSPGKISLILPKPLEGGYQLGYTNNIEKGMSGGALFNQNGEVIGINGMHAYPLWDAPSVFADGKEANSELHSQIVRLSWAVPIDKVGK